MNMSRIPSSFDVTQKELEEMSFWERVKHHCKQQPFVPIGALLTTGAVIMAAESIRVGNKRNAQYYFRWRVGLQAATLTALVAGSIIYGTTVAGNKSKEERMKEKAKMREKLWIQELERRDRETQARKEKAENARLKVKENEESIRQLEKELSELESKLNKK
ncbi:hypothetical protein KAFR_0C05630 [Kazachstania africana CBS 2517]|uniref:Respiratory supercomplex factor 1, mitochondrial n=1 Tax=Kazachstania africana (strain ATCC 22294 / BCRC 22015 / CBS 2517 / CECT 1963 / NBRC 1671 / NRRL Y-8276) TaxID=1071382 RepID=H2AT54_KAZAF|nr:hypothetical protein KAFR_0C05630 [Kazachstania africana CBS 2517]CCF57554.1 hypothetical protein KAFR_0C05630 [Kazachstania africana CBS 2517]